MLRRKFRIRWMSPTWCLFHPRIAAKMYDEATDEIGKLCKKPEGYRSEYPIEIAEFGDLLESLLRQRHYKKAPMQ